jgi:hypothetical protein
MVVSNLQRRLAALEARAAPPNGGPRVTIYMPDNGRDSGARLGRHELPNGNVIVICDRADLGPEPATTSEDLTP